MKSKRVIKETTKIEKLPQENKSTTVISRKYKNNISSQGSNQVTVKETTIEKSYKTTYKKEEVSNAKNVNTSSSLKQGTNYGSSSQNKNPISTKEETGESKYSKYAKYKTIKKKQEALKEEKYSKKDVELIIKIQRWWKKILAILNGYKIREKLRKEKSSGYVIKNKEVVREKYYSNSKTTNKYDSNSGKNITNKINTNNNYKINNNKTLVNSVNSNTSSYSNLNSYSKYSNTNLQKNQNSNSYNNISSIHSNFKKNLNINTNITTSSSQNYIQTKSKQSSAYPQYVGSVSTSPSIKSKYIIETKKVEVFQRPKNYSANKTMSKNTITSTSEINRYEIKDIMQKIWNEESYCSTVESLCCLSDDNKSNASQNNTIIFEEYEEEIRKLRTLLMEKDDELNNLMANLNETKNQLSVKYTSTYNEYNKNKYNKNAKEMISNRKFNWNEVNLPSPVSEIYIESFRTRYGSGMAYNFEKYSQKIKKEESAQETISDSEAVLEIQEMNALSIISNKIKPKNICQHLQSLMILSKKNEEEEPLIFQKIEEINITSIVHKPRNQIQELDGLEIISMRRMPRNVAQNVDKISIKSAHKEGHNMIQELDGLEIIRLEKGPYTPQCVDELEIMREYDMLLVKPTWNSLQIQGSGLNLLAISRDMELENQEIDEFEILGKDKPLPCIQSLDKFTIIKSIIPQKIQVLLPIPENSIKKGERFTYLGVEKEPEIKYIERVIQEKKEVIPNEIATLERIELKGEQKEVIPNEIDILERIELKGEKKEEYVPVKRKGFVEKINKTIITKKEEKKEEIKPEIKPLEMENIESLEINKEYETVKPIVLEKIDWNKMTKPIKSTKLLIKGIPHIEKEIEKEKEIVKEIEKEKEKEDLIIENFAFNLAETSKSIKELELLIEKFNFNLAATRKSIKNLTVENFDINLAGTSKNIKELELLMENFDINLAGTSKNIKELELIVENFGFNLAGTSKSIKELELIIEKFSINLAGTSKKIQELIIAENGGLYIEGSKGMILKEGPAQTIQIKKEQILLPSKNERFDLITEIKKPELVEVNENRIKINGQYQVKVDPVEKVKIVEKIVEKKINWNEFNIIDHSDFNLIQIKPKIDLTKQKTTSIALLGEEMPKPKKEIIEKEKIVTIKKDWNNLLKVQSFYKFGLLGRPKPSKKLKLLVANGDKFFIQKESDDEIIYNDDYNTRKQKKKVEKKEKKEKVEIIKEREIIPRYQREIKAQIARVRESESETSSLSEIDVLAGIKNKSVIGLGGADQELLKLNGYETKILDGEVIFTSKNGLGINLGASQYQKQIKKKISYSKKLSPSASTNKMTGIEINFNPRLRSGMHFEKMSATSGIIGEGSYKVYDDKKFEMGNNGQNFKKKIIIASTETNEINGQPNIVINNRLSGQKSASNIVLRKRESNKSNETPVSATVNNEMKIGKVIFNSKKSDKVQGTPNSTGNMSGKNNIVINSRKEYEKRIVMTGERINTEKVINNQKKGIEIKFKKSKVKNVEPLRDYDSQNSY